MQTYSLPILWLGGQEINTPILKTVNLDRAISEADRKYNLAHVQTRGVVERLFGILKSRYPCLKFWLGNKLDNSMTIVISCAVLHSITRRHSNRLPDDQEDNNLPVNPDNRCTTPLWWCSWRYNAPCHHKTEVQLIGIVYLYSVK